MEPKNLNIKGRDIPPEEMKNLQRHFDGIDYLVDTMHAIDANITNAKDIEAAHTWVQWLINAALQSFDENVESIQNPDE